MSQKKEWRHSKGTVSWRDLPEFCDATAAVSASTFAARRLPEIRALYRPTNGSRSGNRGDRDVPDHHANERHGARQPSRCDRKIEEALQSGGCQTSSRHLRRRATSHNTRKRHRAAIKTNKHGIDSIASTAPTLSLDSPSHWPNQESAELIPVNNDNFNDNNETRPLSRRKKRKKCSTLCHDHVTWQTQPQPFFPTELSNCKVHWIPTHIWHAKRFHMETLWGWKVPVLHTNRSAKAALRLVKEGKTLVRDGSYNAQPICLQIPLHQATEFTKSMKRIIPGFNWNLKKQEALEGMLHHTDKFPLRAIGPVRWIGLLHPLFEACPDKAQTLYVYIWVHNSVLKEARTCIGQWMQLINDIKDAVYFHGIENGMSCFHLRGCTIGACLRQTWKSLGWIDEASLFVDEVFSSWIALTHHGKLLSLSTNTRDTENEPVVYGIIHCPRNPSISCNAGCTGVDLWCTSRHSAKLWCQLVVVGGACPFGLIEGTHLELEAAPPVPVFPRDYPDTQEGFHYWAGASRDYRLYRSCLESGSGRIVIDNRLHWTHTGWSSLVQTKTIDETAVVRGSLCMPFLQCFPSSFQIKKINLTAESKVEAPIKIPRKKRPVDPPNKLIKFPPLSRLVFDEHQSVCQSLIDSLSLPAFLCCHIVIMGKGTFRPGFIVFDYNFAPRVLGRVSSGSFSLSRGQFHGIALCSAHRLLMSFKDGLSFVRVAGTNNGTRNCYLAVRVGICSTTSLVATLSIIS